MAGGRSSLKLIVVFAAFLCLLTSHATAQQNYLEPVGHTEVELMFYLDMETGMPTVERNGNLLTVERATSHAAYTLENGRVIALKFRQTYESRELALEAFSASMAFMEERGLGFARIRKQNNTLVASGEGSGLRMTLILLETQDAYQVHAEANTVR